MQSDIRIDNTSEVCHIEIEGQIGVPEAWQFDDPDARVATYDKFREALRGIERIAAAEVVVDIRSTGGDVNDALLIYDALCRLDARITTRCYGYTASAATIIAQAASEGCREISANALYLIHNAACAAEGNAAQLAGQIDLLRQTDARLAAIYAARSGRPAAEFEALMGENNGQGRWLSPQEALAAGLADRIAQAPSPSLAQNLARGWRRLLAAVGAGRDEQLPDDRNVLHTPPEDAALADRSAIAAEEARRRAAPTATLPREDPSCSEALPTVNQRAYAEDARSLAQLFR